mmetsp:Transcript_19941/g.41974  ORF Transcript_19941/g.41974 Transcript_19941/m.41974 type:complete len:221 (+) Transcript_19941:344-1006(+)
MTQHPPKITPSLCHRLSWGSPTTTRRMFSFYLCSLPKLCLAVWCVLIVMARRSETVTTKMMKTAPTIGVNHFYGVSKMRECWHRLLIDAKQCVHHTLKRMRLLQWIVKKIMISMRRCVIQKDLGKQKILYLTLTVAVESWMGETEQSIFVSCLKLKKKVMPTSNHKSAKMTAMMRRAPGLVRVRRVPMPVILKGVTVILSRVWMKGIGVMTRQNLSDRSL